jgi:hypothetical protein
MTYIMTEYFIDQEKYFYFIMLHEHIALSIGVFEYDCNNVDNVFSISLWNV